LDLAISNNYDVLNPIYVKKLISKYDMPVKVIEVSEKVKKKDFEYAIELA
jgi:hypothetical protein